VYREKKHELDRKYLASGRRHFVRRRRQKKKAEELRMKVREWRKNNPEKRRAFVKRYRANILIHKEREQRRNLADQYIIKAIKRSLGYKIHTRDIPKELIQLERLRLLTKRKLKPL
jgi:DNA integrity scanning protein DisA with diadenylate cyclase activity